MDDFEKAKRLEHLFYIMRKQRMPGHSHVPQEFKMRDMMMLDSIKQALDNAKDGLVKMSPKWFVNMNERGGLGVLFWTAIGAVCIVS